MNAMWAQLDRIPHRGDYRPTLRPAIMTDTRRSDVFYGRDINPAWADQDDDRKEKRGPKKKAVKAKPKVKRVKRARKPAPSVKHAPAPVAPLPHQVRYSAVWQHEFWVFPYGSWEHGDVVTVNGRKWAIVGEIGKFEGQDCAFVIPHQVALLLWAHFRKLRQCDFVVESPSSPASFQVHQPTGRQCFSASFMGRVYVWLLPLV